MPTAVLRRYTPPTCTLEIAAAGSALSRWTDRTVVKNLRFQLSFDDPKLLPDEQIAVSGDQSQLETLCDLVSRYVEALLATPVEQVVWEQPLRSLAGPRESPASTDSVPAGSPDLVTASAAGLEPAHLPDPSPAPSLALPSSSTMSLQPLGLLKHRFNLGSLANAESGEAVSLSTLQLFDLANALEAYQAEAMSLPGSERPAWLRQIPTGWPSMAAAGLLALGLTGAMAKFVLDISRPNVQTASAPQEREVNSELNRELFPTLSPPPLEPSPQITLQPLPPPPPPGGSGAPGTNSPGLPPVGVTQPPANPQPATGSTGAPGTGAAGAAGAGAGTSATGTDGQSVTIFPDPTVASAPAAPLSSASSEPPRLAPTEAEASRAAADSAPSTTTAFDTIPQVAEIRSYFQQNWQPPEGLDQTLEYRLLLNADGSLQRIVPLGQFSENYLDRTSMPLMGEPFVSPTGDGSTPQIRLVLKPDGKVQSFLEYAN